MTAPAAARPAVAVIGMAGRFAAAGSVRAFWDALCAGRDLVRTLTDEDLVAMGVDPSRLDVRRYVRRRGVLAGIDRFAASFFGLARREAELMDPQHRLFLECAWEALEDAGHDPERFDGLVGVFGGSNGNSYAHRIRGIPELATGVGAARADMASRADFLTTRVSYELNLRGPSVAVQTACSTSLVAVHLACQSLLGGECDMALAGGVSVQVPQAGYHYDPEGIASPDGRCRAYDADGRGIVPGNGVGVVVLRRLAEALADGDHVEAVILGTAVNNDGSGKVGFTAPSVEGQAEVIAEALALAGVEPRTIGCVEGHGTGTVLGDPIEVRALRQVFGSGPESWCALGSVKTSVGHQDAAAGVAGLIKAVLALRERMIPASLHHQTPNPGCELEGSAFYVPVELTPWERGEWPRRAGVSSFGIGGTNAHVVLEEAPAGRVAPAGRPVLTLVQSARTRSALERAGSELSKELEGRLDEDMAGVAYTLQVGRRQLEHRRAVVVRGREEAVRELRGEAGVWGRVRRARGVVFMFPGQGAQHVGMGRGLYEGEEVYRRWVDRCSAELEPALGLDLREYLYPAGGREEWAERALEQTRLAQPAQFVTSYALARTWMEWGVRPVAMIGHSLGEYVAACLSGVMGLEEGLRLVAERGRLMQEMPAGAMLGVGLGEEELRARLSASPGEGLGVAAVNGPRQVVVSGPAGAVEALRRELEREGVSSRVLRTSHAFHSAMLEPVVRWFEEVVRGVELRGPEVPYVSNVSGDWARVEEVTDAGYWGRQLREPVRFWRGLETVVEAWEGAVLLEVGPQNTLASLAGRGTERPGRERVEAVPSMRHREDGRADEDVLQEALARLWTLGVAIDWSGYWGGARRRRLSLPTYPFERERCWVGDEPSPDGHLATAPAPPPASGHLSREGGGIEVDAVEAEVLAAWELLVGEGAGDGGGDFFNQGGNSLIAAQLVSLLVDAFDVDLTVRVVFENPTPAALAEAVRSALAAGTAGGAR